MESSARPTPDGIFRLDKQADYNNAGRGGMVLGYCDAHHLIVSLDAGPGLAFTSARLLIPVVDNLPADWPGQAQLLLLTQVFVFHFYSQNNLPS